VSDERASTDVGAAPGEGPATAERSVPVISARGLGKRYRMYRKPIQRVYDLLLPGKPRYTEFWALRGVTLDIRRQSTVGIIGENGAGKSTLLKLISGITHPTEGEVHVSGRVTSLIELGAGFHPEFTGRENIGLSCAILGMGSDEIADRTQSILDFAELGDFIDRPVKTYSSGMHVRLGFSVATCVDPEVLLIDEALAVGDEYFRGKCMNRLNDFRERGGTVVFVSHDLTAVKALCQEVVYLDHGHLVEQGPPEKVAGEYLRRAQSRGKQQIEESSHESSAYPRWGSGEIKVETVELIGPDGDPTVVFRTMDRFRVRLGYRAFADCAEPVFGVGLYREDGTYVNGSNHLWHDHPVELRDVARGEQGEVEMDLGPLPLLPGRYYVTIFVYDHSKPSPTAIDHREHALGFRVLDADHHQHGLLYLPSTWEIRRGPRGPRGSSDGGAERGGDRA